MACEKREQDSPLKENLFNDYYCFSFFRAVHILESLSPDDKPVGHTLNPGEEPVRFSVKPGLLFPPSEISCLSRENVDGPAKMDVAFMGLIGPSGILPHWYNELAVERAKEKDHTIPRFFDIFHHRLISLFYLAWKRNRFPENYLPGAEDRLSHYLLSLIGLGTAGSHAENSLPLESLIFYSGLLSRRTPSVSAITATVEYFSGAQATIDQFVERLIDLNKDNLSKIGAANNALGINTICGSYIKEIQTNFRVNLGPVGFKEYLRFLPNGDSLKPIFSLVKYMAGPEFDFDLRIYLKRDEVPLCSVGLGDAATPRLGWTTWLKTPGAEHKEDPFITFGQTDALCNFRVT